MAAPLTNNSEGYKAPCRKCAGLNGACSMRCPTLNLPANWATMEVAQKWGPGGGNS